MLLFLFFSDDYPRHVDEVAANIIRPLLRHALRHQFRHIHFDVLLQIRRWRESECHLRLFLPQFRLAAQNFCYLTYRNIPLHRAPLGFCRRSRSFFLFPLKHLFFFFSLARIRTRVTRGGGCIIILILCPFAVCRLFIGCTSVVYRLFVRCTSVVYRLFVRCTSVVRLLYVCCSLAFELTYIIIEFTNSYTCISVVRFYDYIAITLQSCKRQSHTPTRHIQTVAQSPL